MEPRENLPRSVIRERIAPCGLDCGRCLARAGGEVQQAARHLLKSLTGFEKHSQRFTGFHPVFGKYPEFQVMAQYLSEASCRGCRAGECLHSGCKVKDCAPAHGVDYCFECPEFPCDKTGFDPMLEERWRRNNERMRELGLAAFYLESLKRPRY